MAGESIAHSASGLIGWLNFEKIIIWLICILEITLDIENKWSETTYLYWPTMYTVIELSYNRIQK